MVSYSNDSVEKAVLVWQIYWDTTKTYLQDPVNKCHVKITESSYSWFGLSSSQSRLREYIMHEKLSLNVRKQEELTIPVRYSFLNLIKRKWD